MENQNELKVGYIYKICNKNSDKIYIGSTVQDLKKRFIKHKSRCKIYLETNNHYITSFEIVKDPTSYIEQLAEIQFYNKKELLQKEIMFIEMYKDICVNKTFNLSIEQKKEKEKKTSKIYYEKNKSKILERNKKKVNCEYCNKIVGKNNLKKHHLTQTCLNNRTQKIEKQVIDKQKTIRIKIKKIL